MALLVGIAGCGTFSNEKIKVTSQAAGTLSALTWISYDNPTMSQKISVVETLNVVQEGIELVTTNSYTETVYPQALAYIAATDKIKINDKPLAIAGTLAMLTGLDLMLDSNPEWKINTEKAVICSTAFIGGSKAVLATVIVPEPDTPTPPPIVTPTDPDCDDGDCSDDEEVCEDGDCSIGIETAVKSYKARSGIRSLK